MTWSSPPEEHLLEIVSRRVDEMLAEIGASMGLTREHIRQLDSKTLEGHRRRSLGRRVG